AFSGRMPGWDLSDHDVAILDANTLELSFIDQLMNICMDLAVNPKSGQVAVIGTDGINEVRYEPVLQSVFTRAEIALAGGTRSVAIHDLNPHLDYTKTNIPPAQRAVSLGDPRGVVWNPSGTRLYVTGMGSDNVVMFDAAGNRLAVSGEIEPGPTGLAFDG